MLRTFRLFLTLSFLASPAFAWNHAGHMIVAAIAYAELTPVARRAVDVLISIKQPLLPSYTKNAMAAATWPDRLKSKKIITFNAWHYINLPYPPSTRRFLQPYPYTVVWAIYNAVDQLKSTTTSAQEKGFYLRFLLHCMGDIHQPLHCLNYHSALYPVGDLGGSIRLLRSRYGKTLHQYWDNGAGFLVTTYHPSYRNIMALAYSLIQQYPKTYYGALAAQTDPARIAQESYALAARYAYPIAALREPDAAYRARVYVLAQQRLTLAGYRLAALLNAIFVTTQPGLS